MDVPGVCDGGEVREARLTSWADRAARARQAQRCVRCGDPCLADMCPECALVVLDKQATRRELYAEAARCRCGRPRAEDRKQCPTCLAADASRERWRERVKSAKPAPCK